MVEGACCELPCRPSSACCLNLRNAHRQMKPRVTGPCAGCRRIVDQTQPAVRDISNHRAPCGDFGMVESEPRTTAINWGGAGPCCMLLRPLLLSCMLLLCPVWTSRPPIAPLEIPLLTLCICVLEATYPSHRHGRPDLKLPY